MERKITRFSVSLPQDLYDELENRVIKKGYASRSELVRDMIREKLVDEKWADSKGDVVGVLTIIYDHHQRELNQKMIDIQHGSYINVLCSTHIHINHHNCLETIMIKGGPDKIEEIAFEIGGLKGVKYAKLTKTIAF